MHEIFFEKLYDDGIDEQHRRNRYGHVTARMKQASAERMEQFIKANSG